MPADAPGAGWLCLVPSAALGGAPVEAEAGGVRRVAYRPVPRKLHGIGGVPIPPPDVVAAEVAFEVAVLAEDLRLQQAMSVRGLPLRLRDERYVGSDRSGVALRSALAAFAGVDQ